MAGLLSTKKRQESPGTKKILGSCWSVRVDLLWCNDLLFTRSRTVEAEAHAGKNIYPYVHRRCLLVTKCPLFNPFCGQYKGLDWI